MTLHQSLSEVLKLADKATAGEWSRNTIMPDKDGEANADFICSAVNLLRTHGPPYSPWHRWGRGRWRGSRLRVHRGTEPLCCW